MCTLCTITYYITSLRESTTFTLVSAEAFQYNCVSLALLHITSLHYEKAQLLPWSQQKLFSIMCILCTITYYITSLRENITFTLVSAEAFQYTLYIAL